MESVHRLLIAVAVALSTAFVSADGYASETVFPDFSGRDRDYRNYRTRITEGMKKGPNFAEKYTIIEIGCGTGCRFPYVADNSNGELFSFPYGGDEHPYLAFEYSIDSNIVFISYEKSKENKCVVERLSWDGKSFTVEDKLEKSLVEYCQPSSELFLLRDATNAEELPSQARVANATSVLLDPEKVGSMSAEEYAAAVRSAPNVNVRDKDWFTPLHVAARVGTPDNIAALVSAGANVNVRNKAGWTILHVTAWVGTPENIAALVSAGADVEAHAGEGVYPHPRTVLIPFHYAIISHYEGWTPLHFATKAETPKNIAALVSAGADVEAHARDGQTPLHAAAEFGAPASIAALVSAGADVNARNKAGQTPLRSAIEGRNRALERIVALLSAGADVNARDKDGQTALYAAGHFPKRIVVLLSAGADVNARDKDGQTALHAVARRGKPKSITALLEAGASGSVKDVAGKTAFDYAEGNDRVKGTDAYWALNDAQYK